MAYVPVPKDLTKVKTKVFFGLTKRQLICFGAGALMGVPLFFLLKDFAGTSVAAFVMVLIMLPAFLLAMPATKAVRHDPVMSRRASHAGFEYRVATDNGHEAQQG